MFHVILSNTIKKMIKSTTLLFGLFVLLIFSVSSQTFTNNAGQAYNTWNSGNVWATALSRTVVVSGLSNPLSAGGTVLKQVNLKLGDGTSVNLTSYSIRLTSPAGTVISILSSGNFNATTAYNVDIKYRDDNILQFPTSSNQNPFNIGYYRTTVANSFSTVNGENPNGNWVLEIVEGTISEVAFVSVDLVFGSAIVLNDVTGTTTNDNCATPQCMGESSVVKATVSAFTGNANDPNTIAPYPGGCNWNGAHNNSAWFVFKPSGTTAKVTISGITNLIQTLIVDESNACIAGSQTVPTGGCPIDAVNDTYTSPRYTPSSGSSSNEQFNLSGLIPGNKYLLVVDGNGGVISPLYIELSGGLIDLCCATVISGATDVCAGSASTLYTQIGGALSGTWSVSPASAGTIDAAGNFTPGSPLANVAATISYDDGSCTKTFSVTVHAAPVAGIDGAITVCSNGSSIDLFSSLTGSPDVTGTWTGASTLTGGNLGTYDPSLFTPGIYTYTVAATACISDVSTVTVTESLTPNAGIDGVITVCSNGSSIDLFSSLTGSPDVTGTWTGLSTLTGGNLGTYDPSLFTPGIYTYTVAAIACVSDVSTVIVTETLAPTSGIVSVIDGTLCSGNTTTASSTIAGGTWTSSDPLVATVDLNTGVVNALTAGTSTMTYTVLGTAGCLGTNATSTINVTVTDTPLAPTGNLNQGFCNYDGATVADIATVSGASIQWYDSAVNGTLLPSTTSLVNGNHYYATQTIAGCESVTRLDVEVYLDSIGLNLIFETASICNQQTGVISVEGVDGIGTYSYSWSNGMTGSLNTSIGAGSYVVTVIDSLGCTSQLNVDLSCIGIIPEIITPNGDGKNDTWIINVDSKVLVQLYNRWGNLIYTAIPYLDDWDGKANEGLTIGNEYLPNGTYFYIIDYKNGNEPTSGYIELIR